MGLRVASSLRKPLEVTSLNGERIRVSADIGVGLVHLSGASKDVDQLLHEAIGMSITGQIWSRRLDQAAADLRDPLRASAAAAQIAFANGFEDSAHFTRAFKRRFGQSPAQWRHALGSAA